MAAELPSYVTLDEAARRYRIDPQVLTRLVESGKIKAVQVGGRIAVAEQDVRAASIAAELWEQVAHLDGQPITLNRARTAYGIGSATLYKWIQNGIVRVIKRVGNGKATAVLLNEADVAYAMLVATQREVRRGRKTFTPEFLPPHLQRS